MDLWRSPQCPAEYQSYVYCAIGHKGPSCDGLTRYGSFRAAAAGRARSTIEVANYGPSIGIPRINFEAHLHSAADSSAGPEPK